MDTGTVKLALAQMIADSDPRLSPRTKHVLMNWHVPSWKLTMDTFPIVTVRMQMRQTPIWSFKPPTIAHGELYFYDFTAYVFGESMATSRELADAVIDYLGQHNKDPANHIIDIVALSVKESVSIHGPKRYWRTIVSGRILTEESLT